VGSWRPDGCYLLAICPFPRQPGTADPAVKPEPVACRIAAMLEIRLSFGRASCKAAAFPDKTQTFSKA